MRKRRRRSSGGKIIDATDNSASNPIYQVVEEEDPEVLEKIGDERLVTRTEENGLTVKEKRRRKSKQEKFSRYRERLVR